MENIVSRVVCWEWKNFDVITGCDKMCSNTDWIMCNIYNFIEINPVLSIFIWLIVIIGLYLLFFRKSNKSINSDIENIQKDNKEVEYKYLIDIWTAFNYETNEYTLNNRQLSFTSSEKEKIISIGSFIITELNVWNETDDWKYEITISLWDSEETYYTNEYNILWENYIQFINSDWDEITAVWKINIIESV